jgi:hypothetical protein
MLDWGFGRGRSARTGLRLPDYVRPASVAALLTRPPRPVERDRATISPAAAAAEPARVQTATGPRPAGLRALRTSGDRARVATAAGAVAALLAAVALAVHRLRQRA